MVKLYFREAVADYLKEWCKDNMDLYSDGLRTYTTLDSRMQKHAEIAVDKQMRIVQNNFNNHWGRENPRWQDANHKEIVNFIEDIAKGTLAYKALQSRYPDQPDSVTFYMNKPHRLKALTTKLVKDTTFSTMDSIRYMERFMHTGFVLIEPQTGYVKAWVGRI